MDDRLRHDGRFSDLGGPIARAAGRIFENMPFTLNEGQRVIGEGVVTRIVGTRPGAAQG